MDEIQDNIYYTGLLTGRTNSEVVIGCKNKVNIQGYFQVSPGEAFFNVTVGFTLYKRHDRLLQRSGR